MVLRKSADVFWPSFKCLRPENVSKVHGKFEKWAARLTLHGRQANFRVVHPQNFGICDLLAGGATREMCEARERNSFDSKHLRTSPSSEQNYVKRKTRKYVHTRQICRPHPRGKTSKPSERKHFRAYWNSFLSSNTRKRHCHALMIIRCLPLIFLHWHV